MESNWIDIWNIILSDMFRFVFFEGLKMAITSLPGSRLGQVPVGRHQLLVPAETRREAYTHFAGKHRRNARIGRNHSLHIRHGYEQVETVVFFQGETQRFILTRWAVLADRYKWSDMGGNIYGQK